ncbi:MAG: hypothetical protein ACR2NX_00280 [Chthoniobacterales bacterium]
MSAPEPEKAKLRLVIGHVLFLDIVGYSKLLMNEQSEALQDLNQSCAKPKRSAKRTKPDS